MFPVALIGAEEETERHVRRIKDADATNFCGHVFGDDDQMTRTRAFLAGLGGEFQRRD